MWLACSLTYITTKLSIITDALCYCKVTPSVIVLVPKQHGYDAGETT
jgi:hypothetical protein